MNESVNKLLRVRREIQMEIGRAPSNEEISRRIGIPVKEVQKIKIRAAANSTLGETGGVRKHLL
jgi:DNA-directed RNA polymerase sigma subunit (sigma70/sigma32)